MFFFLLGMQKIVNEPPYCIGVTTNDPVYFGKTFLIYPFIHFHGWHQSFFIFRASPSHIL
jgi:hypothetical protein